MKVQGRRWLVACGVLATAAAFVWAWRPDPVVVETASVVRGELLVTIDEEGEMRARDRYVIAAPVSGRIARLSLRDGDAVAAGQVIAEIWPVPLSAREREEQTARVAAADAAASAAQAQLRRALTDHAQAARERGRVEQLVARQYVAPQAGERARADELMKRDELAAARSRLGIAKAELDVARAALMAIVARPGEQVAAPLVSPVAGRVLRIVERSERVVTAGSALVTVGDPRSLEAMVDLLSQDAVRVRPGMTMRIEGWGGEPLEAKVRMVEPYAYTKVSALGVEEQRVNVLADLADTPPGLGDGYRIEARIVVDRIDNALKLPMSALFRDGAGWRVFAVEGGRAVLREVQVASRSADEAALAGGLAEGALVVRHPSNKLSDGTRVETR